MSGSGLALAAAVVAVGSTLQGAVGFGLALVSVPFLVLIDPRLVPGPMISAGLVLTLLMAAREWRGMDRPGLVWGTLGRLPGTALGAAALTAIPLEQMGVAVGALVIFAVALSLSGLHPRPTARTLVAAGALSGFMGTISSIGGPPLALVYQHEAGPRLRSTLAGYFVIGGVVSLAALAVVGRFGWRELGWSLGLAPGAVAGFAASRHLAPLVDRGYTRRAVLAVSTAAALLAIGRYAL